MNVYILDQRPSAADLFTTAQMKVDRPLSDNVYRCIVDYTANL